MNRAMVLGLILLAGMCGTAAGPVGAQEPQVPEEARKQLQEALGPPFILFRGKMQEELKLTDELRRKLDEQLLERVQDAMQLFGSLEGLKPEEREKKLMEYRQKVHGELAAFTKKSLTADQLKRLHQVELQLEGAFALGQPAVGEELKLTMEQRMKFQGVVQELVKKIEPLVKESQTGGNPNEIRPKVLAIRKEHEVKLEALLTESQKKQWKEMLGKPLEID